MNLLLFSHQFTFFDTQGQAPTPTPPVGGVEQYLVSSFDVTEQFVTGGRISAMDISYPFNSHGLSRRTN